MGNAIEFRGVWKEFQRGEIHDSLRDLIPAFLRRAGRKERRRKGDSASMFLRASRGELSDPTVREKAPF